MKVDALDMPFGDESFEAIISSHMIHHLANPRIFLREMARVLKPGGLLIIQETHASLVTRAVLRFMRHEGWSYEIDVFSQLTVANDPRDPWSGNNAVAQMLFSSQDKFEHNVSEFKIIHNKLCECFLFLVSGGMCVKTPTLQLPNWMLRTVVVIDSILVKMFPSVFAMGRQVVLQKSP